MPKKLDSIINIMGKGGYLYDHLMREVILTLTMNKVLIQNPNIKRKVVTDHDLDALI